MTYVQVPRCYRSWDRVDTVFYPPAWGHGMHVGGGVPRTPSGVEVMGAGTQGAPCEHKPLLRPVVGLTENLPKKDLEIIVGEAIRTHRRLRDEAEALHAPYVEVLPTTGETVGPARLAWLSAMVRMHAQQALLSTLLDVLGYVPEAPDEREAPRRVKSA